MDPASSLELASGILSFILFAGKLIKGGVEIYQNGGLAENATLHDVIEKMESFHSRHKLPADDEDVNDILTDCSNVCAQLLQLLKRMEPPGSKGGFRAAWRSLSASWNNVIREKEKKELEEKLGRCHGRLGLLLVWSTSIAVDKLSSSASNSEDTMDQIQESIDKLNSFLREGSGMGWLANSVAKEVERSISDQEAKLHDMRVHQFILRSLEYGKMRDRSSMLKQHLSVINEQQKENGGTFQWIFEPQASNVSDNEEELKMKNEARNKWRNWISSQSDAGVFHIAGKFGSGKSTLMQFLFEHPQTQVEFEQWAGDRKLVKVNFFFSVIIGGTQQLLEGLCRTLLYDILDQCPKLSRDILPEAWNITNMLHVRGEDITGRTIVEDSSIPTALDKLFAGCDPNYCFCLFIDGLDEYQDPNGRDQRDLVKLIKRWASGGQNKPVKICVASREDPAFFNKFPPESTVRLHDLTRYDMERYAEERLRGINNENIRNQLIMEIPEKAQGVFLWVRLVVQEIREDLEVGDPSVDALDRFPAGLRPLLTRMMDSIPERHRQKAYLSFSMLLELAKPIDQRTIGLFVSEAAYSFLQDYCTDQDFAYKMQISKWWIIDYVDHDPAARRVLGNVRKVGTQLRAWCKGFLDTARSDPWSRFETRRIVFTHRSIQEYLAEPAVQVKLSKGLVGLSPLDAILQLLLAEFTHNGRAYDFTDWVFDVFLLRTQHGLDKYSYAFLDRWRHVALQRKMLAAKPPDDEETRKTALGECDYALWKFQSDPTVFDDSFYTIMMAYTVLWAAEARFNSTQPVFDCLDLMLVKGRKVLLEFKTWVFQSLKYHLSRYSLEFETSNPLTIWQHFLLNKFSTLREEYRSKSEAIQPRMFSSDTWPAFGKVVEAFLRAGADPYMSFSSINHGGETSTTLEDRKPIATLQLGHDVALPCYYTLRGKFDDFDDPASSSSTSLASRADGAPFVQTVLDYKNPFTFRDWIELLDIPNRDVLLDLIDRGLAVRSDDSDAEDLRTGDQEPRDLNNTESHSNLNRKELPEAETNGTILQDKLPEAATEPQQLGIGDFEQPAPCTIVPAPSQNPFQYGYLISFILGVFFAYIFLVFCK
ncbi:hypothetical protein QBC38DRAFT_549299 [Podospora fimiseda]|uniref:Nephrocystin 3-like N-terminal domain-containing protein n=1 Tax=Podospora fimiseda TaxID=252190 RepID=A0AAN6YNH1_9PEZI|nr:hypothetical protein QBC38DRAFT_549299 [Podospora fimiseda]